MSDETTAELVEQVRSRYAEAARAVLNPERTASGGCGEHSTGSAALDTADCFGGSLYEAAETDDLPEEAVLASLGCGNPLAVADLRPGETVLDLGSGGGLDVLLSARRVGPSGTAYGLDASTDMLAFARSNAARAGLLNARFVHGRIEDIPLPDGSVDVIISNCVVNLSPDKDRVLREAFRVLRPGGRLAISDVVIRDGGPNELDIPFEVRRSVELWSGCIAGALTESKYLRGMRAAGFTAPEVQEVRRYRADDIGASFRRTLRRQGILGHQAADAVAGRFMSAIVRATKPK